MRTILLGTMMALALAAGARADEPKLETDEEKTMYALGLAMSQNLAPLNLSEKELTLVEAGLADGVLKREKKVDLTTFGPKINELASARMKAGAEANKKAAQPFLEKAAAEKGARKTASGLVYKELKAGSGDAPKASDTVKVHYTGTLTDGTVFDSSVKRGEPATFPVSGVIKCWTEGLQMMKVGGKAKLVCPSDIAYGDQGRPPQIGPGAPLVFEVELLEIVKK
jgi:FKBP-type peptidyl-prolyl cis-trans isomerase FkpA/FKBP-type peptidyl-prolyl cis-trans isomerase FklB